MQPPEDVPDPGRVTVAGSASDTEWIWPWENRVMALTNPWLAEPMPNQQLNRARLEDRILNLLSTHNMCVLATTGDAGPLATPIRYFHLGFTLMFTASPRSPKMKNIGADPRVSIGVHAPLVGLAGSRGAQIFGRAISIPSDDPSFAEYWEAFRWESEQIEQGRSPDDDPGGVVVVQAERIVYTEHWLRREGFAPRQFWKRE